MEILQNIIRNSLYLGVGQGISGLLYFLATVYLARTLGAEKFGMFSFAESVFLFFSLIVIWGSDFIGAREIARVDKDKGEDLVKMIIPLRMIFSIVAFIFMLLFILFIKNPIQTKLMILICGLGLFSFVFLLDWFFWGLEKFNIYAKYTILRDLFFLLGVLIIVNLKVSFLWIGVVFLLSKFIYSILLLIVYLKTYQSIKFIWSFIEQRRVAISCTAFFLASLVGWVVHYFNIMLISFLHKEKAAGYYSAAYKPIFYIIMVVVIYLKAIFPILSKVNRSNLLHFKNTLLLMFGSIILILLPIVILGFYFSNYLIFLFYGKDYLQSIYPFRILLFVLLIMSINMVYSYGLIASGRERENLKVNLILGGSNIFLGLLLIPAMGIVGAAWGMLVSQIIGFLFYNRELAYVVRFT